MFNVSTLYRKSIKIVPSKAVVGVHAYVQCVYIV